MKSASQLWRTFVAAGFVLGAVSAEAADLGNRNGSIRGEEPPQVTSKQWSGLRVFGELGYLGQTDRVEDDEGKFTFDVESTLDALKYGGGLGFDSQIDRVVVGVFAGISWTNKGHKFRIPKSHGNAVIGDVDIDHIVYAGGRLGYLVTPSTLLYGHAGYAWVHGDTVLSYKNAGDAFGDRGGLRIGAGVETMFSQNWKLGLEYGFIDLGDDTLKWSDKKDAVANVDSNIHEIGLRLGYHF